MHVYTEVELKGTKTDKKVRMFVDTGATRTILPYKLAEEIGVNRTNYRKRVEYGDGNVKELELAYILLKVLDRESVEWVLLDNIKEPILGVETLEGLGLKVNPEEGKIEPSREWIARA